MRLRFPWSALGLLAMLSAATPALTTAADAPPRAPAAETSAPPAPLPATPDSVNTWKVALESARAAYQAAWSSRQSGQFNVAVSVCDRAIARISQMLALDPDMTTRRELTELGARMSGLRDAAKSDLASANSAKASGNEPDEKVLNTPAGDDIEPQWNDQVEHYVEFFTGAGRSTFERWLKRSGRYMGLFRSVLQREGLPPDLVHLVFVESGFNVNARSVSAAVGPWQFISGTGKLFGLTVNQWTDERKDPEKSTVAAARYLKHLYGIFGDWPLALASYNAGEGTVLRAIKAQGTMNYWDLRLPRQTEDYVPQFMAALAIARDPAKYGFDSVELDDPMEFDQVAFKGSVDLRTIAKLTECTVGQLKELNPAVLRHAATGRDGITTLRVPHGKGEVLQRKIEEGQRLPAVDLTLKHTVRRGESLQKIANQYHVSARQLALKNGIGRRHPLRRGMTLTIPASLSAPAPHILEASDPRASTDYVPSRNLGLRATLNGNSSAEGRTVVTVRRGETLSTIAQRYGVSVDDLKKWNRLKTNTVKRGTRLKVRKAEASGSPSSVEPGPVAGDTPRANESQTAGATASDANEPVAAASDSASRDRAAASAAARATPGVEDRKGATAKSVARAQSNRKVRNAQTTRRSKSADDRPQRTVVVRPGDTLDGIASRNGIKVAQLKRANGLKSDRVRAGQRLKIPQG